MAGRRAFLAGLLATGLCPSPTWADAGNPRYLSAAKRPDGRFVLCGLDTLGRIVFEVPLEGRGHAAAAHPTQPMAVAFARRPGTFAVVIDCATGHERARLSAPAARHFYGHGAFSADGGLLFTTENDFDGARGVIGIWDVRAGFRRVGEVPSGGVGPHDIKRLPDGKRLAIANGGIETHPETGRAKLNIPTMRPNLAILDVNGVLQDKIELDTTLRKNSIRHLAVNRTGDIAFAMQWQGDVSDRPPLLGVLSDGAGVRLLSPTGHGQPSDMQGYAGSVAFSEDGQHIAITSPRSGLGQIFAKARGALEYEVHLADTCGVAGLERSFILSSGTGEICVLTDQTVRARTRHRKSWDNHLIDIAV